MNSRVIHWYLQRITGAALVVLLVMHFWIEHYAANVRHGGATFATMQQRLSNPIMQAIDISFLLVALYHGLNGLRNIILDYGRIGVIGRRVTTVVVWILGIAWAYWGITAFVGNVNL